MSHVEFYKLCLKSYFVIAVVSLIYYIYILD
jgi:hypothetical protein